MHSPTKTDCSILAGKKRLCYHISFYPTEKALIFQFVFGSTGSHAATLGYSSNLENLVATRMTLLLYFFTMLRRFSCDIGAADVTVYLQSELFSSRAWSLGSYRIFWSRTLKRVYHFLHDTGQSVLNSYDPDTTPFSPRNWRFRSYRFI